MRHPRQVLIAAAMFGLVGCGQGAPPATAPTTTTSSAAPIALVTVVLTVLSVSPGTPAEVRYTCMKQDQVTECGPDRISVNGLWTHPLTAPVGTTVHLDAVSPGSRNPPKCSIDSYLGGVRKNYKESLTGSCSVVLTDAMGVTGNR